MHACVCVCVLRFLKTLLYASTVEVPDCVTPRDPVIIKWDVDPERQYEYSIIDSNGAVVRSEFLPNLETNVNQYGLSFDFNLIS